MGDSVLREEAELHVACQDLHQLTATQRQQIPLERVSCRWMAFMARFWMAGMK